MGVGGFANAPLLSVVATEDLRRAIGTRFVCGGGCDEISLIVEIVLAVSAAMLGLSMLAVEMDACFTGRMGTEVWNCGCGCGCGCIWAC